MAITQEQAEIAATEWCGVEDSPVRRWLISAILDPKQHRDIGKFLAPIAEIIVRDWLVDKTGIDMCCVSGKAYDIIENKYGKRIQVKFRMGVWHLETTRRNSIANKDTNTTGHIAYRNNEFDLLVIFIPGPTFGLTGSRKCLIPVSALNHPKRHGQLIVRVNTAMRKEYDNDEKVEEILNETFPQIHSSPQGLCQKE